MAEEMNDMVLIRFLNKETSAQENEEILRWVSSSDNNRRHFRELHQAYHFSSQKLFATEINIDQAWNTVNSKLPKSVAGKKIISLQFLNRIAVSILLLMSISFAGLWINEHYFAGTRSATVTFEAPSGEKSKVILADGTQVWLNSESRLLYDASKPRTAVLYGEGYFEVKADRSHPFEVITGSGMKVKVTGTRFNLRNYASESIVETSLEEGEVILEAKNSTKLAVMKPGQLARYDTHCQLLNIQHVDPEIYSIWRKNELQFSNISFAELVPRIERWYGISIVLKTGTENNDRFTMTIKTESLRELLAMMQLTSKFDYEINGSHVNIRLK